MRKLKRFWRVWLVLGTSLALVAISLGLLGAIPPEANASFIDAFDIQDDT